jgi:monofunctional biosynthetic peptidoglycan transglycosylase
LRRVSIAILAFIVASLLVVLALRFVPPPTTAFVVAYRVATPGPTPVDRRWVPMARIAPALAIAVVASEDQTFPKHHGFDLESIGKAWDERAEGGRVRGASTISQQVAKNLFLWSGRSWFRKGLEAWFTLLIELTWSKQRILEVYLNVAEFGPGVYGAEAAAQRYFGTGAHALSRHQSALLAAVLPSPRRLRANRPSAYVAQRARWIERQVAQLGGPAYLGAE